jgi:hypothetical protein
VLDVKLSSFGISSVLILIGLSVQHAVPVLDPYATDQPHGSPGVHHQHTVSSSSPSRSVQQSLHSFPPIKVLTLHCIGRNPIYMDKNYAGTLIVWDRLFGTFEPESEEAIYGITHAPTTVRDSSRPLFCFLLCFFRFRSSDAHHDLDSGRCGRHRWASIDACSSCLAVSPVCRS